jgi:glycosyltransferase involved in cell wall biosynthesis
MTLAARQTLRVLMVTGAYYPEMSSSAIQCREMARLLAGRVHIHVLTTALDRALPPEDTVDGVTVTRVAVDVRRGLSKLRASARLLSVLFRLLPGCDVVHVHGFSTKNVIVTAMAKLLRRPVVLSLHTAGFDEARTIRDHGSLAWWAFTHADRYLAVSAGLAEAYLAEGLPADLIQLAPNGIHLQRFTPADAAERQALRNRLGLPRDRPIVLCVGFFSRDKQPRVLFDAWLRVREQGVDSVLVFVGATRSTYFEVDENLVESMSADAAARGLGTDVVFAGLAHNVEDYFRSADLFALPSRREGLPVALLEAMACGLPCAASRLPGSTDTIIEHEKSGLLLPPGDVPALADAIVRVLSHPSLATALGAAARDTIVRRFSHVTTADLWLKAYEHVAAEGA